MQDEFLRIQGTLRKSIVFITHDFLEALRIADRMMIMRDGRCVQIGTPADLITHPADDYVREFTEDVPMGRVLKARDVLDPGVAVAQGMLRADCETKVEDLLALLAANRDGIVAMREGAPLGVVTANSVIAALASHDRAAAR
ncbi:MAG: glycine betaine/L-proline ABC transporter ATP-binding protein, partial [Rhodobacteraceae bacterium]|nr:glycine betaine/L-proline ABC transporter ATP-binding protein [Paracoccaceae bacterium]